jgi:hypothetical protein
MQKQRAYRVAESVQRQAGALSQYYLDLPLLPLLLPPLLPPLPPPLLQAVLEPR